MGSLLPSCPWSDYATLKSDDVPLEAMVSHDEPYSSFRLPITANEDAFWGLGEKEQSGELWLIGDAFDIGTSGEPPVCEVGVAVGVGTERTSEIRELTFEDSDSAGLGNGFSWFSGVCVEAGGCSRTGTISFSLVDPVPGEAVEIAATVQAELHTTGGGGPGGDPQLTIEVEKVY